MVLGPVAGRSPDLRVRVSRSARRDGRTAGEFARGPAPLGGPAATPRRCCDTQGGAMPEGDGACWDRLRSFERCCRPGVHEPACWDAARSNVSLARPALPAAVFEGPEVPRRSGRRRLVVPVPVPDLGPPPVGG
ncbi:unnamed protein product, partial [Prorocentrum cordatum]